MAVRRISDLARALRPTRATAGLAIIGFGLCTTIFHGMNVSSPDHGQLTDYINRVGVESTRLNDLCVGRQRAPDHADETTRMTTNEKLDADKDPRTRPPQLVNLQQQSSRQCPMLVQCRQHVDARVPASPRHFDGCDLDPKTAPERRTATTTLTTATLKYTS